MRIVDESVMVRPRPTAEPFSATIVGLRHRKIARLRRPPLGYLECERYFGDARRGETERDRARGRKKIGTLTCPCYPGCGALKPRQRLTPR
jgi:hypothetical protein